VLRSRGLGLLMNPRRIPPTLGTAIGAACAVALIGLAPAARADDLDPYVDLFGSQGINTWTVSADSALSSTQSASMDASVDNFVSGIPDGNDTPFQFLLSVVDPSAFSFGLNADGELAIDPIGIVGDLARTLDYSLFVGDPSLGPALTNVFELAYFLF
jgi:hypothetical protein